MARMPGTTWKPLGHQTEPPMTAKDIVCIHTMVGSLDGADHWFRSGNGAGYSGAESHFGVGHDGEIRQWQDTDYQADANLDGTNVISIENADRGPGFPLWDTRGDNVPPLTPAQIEANAQIIAWAYATHGIPIELIPDTRPGRRGVGFHAQGVPGNGLVPGGVAWSKSRGKVCPGRRRIAQIPAIIARVRHIAGLDRPAPAPEDTMPETRKIVKNANGPDVWIGDGITRRHIEDPDVLSGLVYQFGPGLLDRDGQVFEWADLRVLGRDVSAGDDFPGTFTPDIITAAVDRALRDAAARVTG